jgi:hypothetical protein
MEWRDVQHGVTEWDKEKITVRYGLFPSPLFFHFFHLLFIEGVSAGVDVPPVVVVDDATELP